MVGEHQKAWLDWLELGFSKDPDDSRRIRFKLHEDQALDFIDLPAPVLSIGEGPLGVTFQCADRSFYVLTSDSYAGVADWEQWRVRCVFRC